MCVHVGELLLGNKKLEIPDGEAHATTPSGLSRFHFTRCISTAFFCYTKPFPAAIDHGMSDIE